MKYHIILLFLFSVLTLSVSAQQANDILGIAKENKTPAYYAEQKVLWKNITDDEPKNARAWVNYYAAQRAYLQLTEKENWANDQESIFSRLKQIIDASEQHIDGTFEYYYMRSYNTRSDESIAFTKKAFAIDPDRWETHGSLLSHYAKTGNHKDAEVIAKKMIQNNHYSHANFMWNYNSLMTTKKNAIFITSGDMDTLPKWVIQYGKGIRSDVLVLNKFVLIHEKEHRQRVLKDIGVSDLEPKENEGLTEYADRMVVHIMKNATRPVYLGCGTPVSFFEKNKIDDKMFLTGLAFLYSENDVDNLAMTKKNFEQNYDLEYLTNNFQIHSNDEVVNRYMNPTYLPGLMKLKKHYQHTNEKEKEEYYTNLIKQIAEDSGRKEEILSWF